MRIPCPFPLRVQREWEKKAHKTWYSLSEKSAKRARLEHEEEHEEKPQEDSSETPPRLSDVISSDYFDQVRLRFFDDHEQELILGRGLPQELARVYFLDGLAGVALVAVLGVGVLALGAEVVAAQRESNGVGEELVAKAA